MRYILLLVLMLLPMGVRAQQTIFASTACSKSLSDIYSCAFKTFEFDVQHVEDPALKVYLREYASLMKYTIANNEANYELYLKASDNAMDAVEDHPYENTLMCNLQLHRCLVEMSKGNLWTGGVQFWRAYQSYKDGEDEHHSYDGQLKLRGIFNILLSQIPDKWRRIAGFLGFGTGDLEVGLRQIETYRKAVAHVPGVNDESLLLSFANIFLSHEQRIDTHLSEAMKRSNSPVVAYTYLLSMGRKQQGEEADSFIATIFDDMYSKFPLLMHQRAKFALRRLDFDAAKRYADRFFETYEGVSCKGDALLIKAYAHKIEGNEIAANQLAQKCIAYLGESDVDKRILADAQRVSTDDVVLLKSRMLFEYGLYDEAKKILVGYTPQSQHAIEYQFRLARTEERLGNMAAALAHYDRVIAMSANDTRYFGPYAAVYAADIKIAAKNKDSALQYLNAARNLNNGEFSKELEQRITLGMRVIEKMK